MTVSSLAMPRSDSSFSNPARSTKSLRTGSCRSFFQSIFTAPLMWPLSYALVSSSTSTRTRPGSSRWACTQSASTRTSERLMLDLLLVGFLPVSGSLASGRDTSDEQVQLAAQAEADGSVQERGDQAGGGSGDAQRGRTRRIADHADDREDQADALGEPRRRLGFQFRRRAQPGPDEQSVDQAVRGVAHPEERSDREHRRLGGQQPGA